MVDLDPDMNGGVFTGFGVIDNGLGTGGTFTATVPGTYAVTYTLNSPNGCSNVFTRNIEVFESVDATINDIALDCDASQAGQISLSSMLGSGSTTGGLFALASESTLTAPFINEIAYDDAGTDDMEFVEIAGPAGFDLSNCTLQFYSAAGTELYNTLTLSGIIPNESGGVGAVVFPVSPIQNGVDGVALECGGTLIEFISYEGTFTPTTGPAAGVVSTNIGMDNNNDDSLQNTGTDSSGPWVNTEAATPGTINTAAGQGFGASGSDGFVTGSSTLQYNEPGCYEITYSVSSFDMAGGACADMDNGFVLIPEHPEASFSIQDAICISAGDSPVVLTSFLNSPTYINDVTRIWITDDANLMNATSTVDADGIVTITPSGGEVSGTIDVQLIESIENIACGSIAPVTCTDTLALTIHIMDGTNQDASFTFSGDLCPGSTITLVPTTPGGVFTGEGVTDNGNGTGGVFTPTGSGASSITYTLNTPNGCTNSFTQTITIDDEPPVITCPEDVEMECGAGAPPSDSPTTGSIEYNHNENGGTSYAGLNNSNGLISSVEDITFGPGVQLLDNNGNPAMIPNGSTFEHILTNAQTSTACLLYTSPSPRDRTRSRMPSSA